MTRPTSGACAPRGRLGAGRPDRRCAALPTYKLAEAAKGTLKVVLTGEGGDELFGGYGRYRRAALRWAALGRPPRTRGVFRRASAPARR